MVISSLIGITERIEPQSTNRLKACLWVHYLEKILRSSTLPLQEANAGKMVAPRSNWLPICSALLNARACPWRRSTYRSFVRADGEQSPRYSTKWIHFSTIAPKETAIGKT